MLPVVGSSRSRRRLIRNEVEKAVLEQEQRAVVGPAKSLRSFDDLVQNRLKPGRASDRPQDTADRLLLLARVFELPRKVRVRGRDAAHRQSLVRCSERADKLAPLDGCCPGRRDAASISSTVI
jgi:hypothetical protein